MNLTATELNEYDHIIVFFSAGKDSVAEVLKLLEDGADPEKIELWHHDIDGREGSHLMDWPVTPAYCRAFAKAFNLKLYFSWREGGFEREMLRNNTPTGKTWFETPDGLQSAGGKGKGGTRLRFPQVAADLKVRWCSAYLKIDVGDIAIRNQERFKGKKILTVSGERGEESPCRAKRVDFEPDRTDSVDREVFRYRPIKDWTEEQVWDIMRRWKVNPHPCYWLGWGRCSCAGCIFGSDDQWASLNIVNPMQFDTIYEYEVEFGTTIHRNGTSIADAAARGTPYMAITPERMIAALSLEYTQSIIVEDWQLPPGAFGDATGPS